MAFYAATYVYGNAEVQAEHRPAHREYLGAKYEEGVLVASGPFVTGDTPGALLIFKADSQQEVADILAQDPMTLGGAVLETTLREWNPVFGNLGA
ncbi:YciI family protein [Rothia sp. ZJ1223]|uniref:YciI family protein n=1 Tax=Rothia sp. ZJ1223 TaxID=2811098 RepID=UPI0019583AD6|nr:YciI family protein [Rothia sp. ZJ1223]MBM7051364.1 hypothetical protein [Rothia sp. ZJ1223]